MKNWLRSYFYHSSIEGKGITALLLLLTILLSILAFTTQYIPRKTSLLKRDTALSKAWDLYKAKHATKELPVALAENTTDRLFVFDPNTLDSAGFIKLGLRPVTTRLLLNWRRKGKVFRQKEEFSKLYTLTKEEYNRLAPYITINNTKKDDYAGLFSKNELNSNELFR